ncbi:hypothetical protein OMP40_16330 [Cohnella rhizosphaerae]|uniref:Uncharacterized protein n=1 Tax=Cohnella rhizosphaerae TaxID=1457232 RepID=A0A9X4QTV1_9BACL|nr:hypothetical protein [Cohnella rhizosphaerae]MDG0810763.1 hypothetical protein [Cohnella rhizosphaerae]
MMAMPVLTLSLILENACTRPSNTMSPEYVPCGYTPLSTFISVDLPAPFSPIRQWISPRSTLKLTSVSALTPGNSFVMLFISKI